METEATGNRRETREFPRTPDGLIARAVFPERAHSITDAILIGEPAKGNFDISTT